jgi:hypothetical protein
MCEANDKCSEKPDEEGRAAYFFWRRRWLGFTKGGQRAELHAIKSSWLSDVSSKEVHMSSLARSALTTVFALSLFARRLRSRKSTRAAVQQAPRQVRSTTLCDLRLPVASESPGFSSCRCSES